jgi:hypothetical protein
MRVMAIRSTPQPHPPLYVDIDRTRFRAPCGTQEVYTEEFSRMITYDATERDGSQSETAVAPARGKPMPTKTKPVQSQRQAKSEAKPRIPEPHLKRGSAAQTSRTQGQEHATTHGSTKSPKSRAETARALGPTKAAACTSSYRETVESAQLP